MSNGEATFLISAAHVLDEIADLHFYIEPGTIRKLTGQLLKTALPPNAERRSDKLDVGVLRLEGPGLPPYPKVGKRSIPISELYPAALPREDKQYLLVGFPESKSRADPNKKQITSEPVSFRNISASPDKYAQLNVMPESHIVIPLNIRHTFGLNKEIQTFPKPSGLSGSPLWLLHDESDPDGPSYFPVVGIAIEHHKKLNVLVATDINVAIKLINAAT